MNISCVVETSEVVDVPVTLSIELFNSNGHPRFITTSILKLTNSSCTKSILNFDSFGRDHSGFYVCTANTGLNSVHQTPISTSKSIVVTVGEIPVINVTMYSKIEFYFGMDAGVYLLFKGVVYGNNSVLSISDIGETDTDINNPQPIFNDALQCVSDRMPCCRFGGYKSGDWYFPNMSQVPHSSAHSIQNIYRNRGPRVNDGTVNLNRLNTDIISPTGLFCCRVSDTTNTTVTMCANIGECMLFLQWWSRRAIKFAGLLNNIYRSCIL